MTIEYKTSKIIEETRQLEIEDEENVFLQGVKLGEDYTTWFGIWKNQKGRAIVTLEPTNIRYYSFTEDHDVSKLYIEAYLEKNSNVKVITKEEFKDILDMTTPNIEMKE